MSIISEFLLVVLVQTVSSSSWICDLPGLVSLCLPPKDVSLITAWTTPRNFCISEQRMREFDLSVKRCSAVCAQQGCSLMAHDLGRGCAILSSNTTSPSEQMWSMFRPVPSVLDRFPNVALHKTVTASSTAPTGNFHISRTYATDGDTRPEYMYHSNNEPNPWILVDLEETFLIKTVRILPRAQYLPDRFISISIRLGTAPLPGPDFSSYSEAVLIPGPPTNPVTFFEHTLQTLICARYVSVQRTATTGTSYLEIAELEVIGIIF